MEKKVERRESRGWTSCEKRGREKRPLEVDSVLSFEVVGRPGAKRAGVVTTGWSKHGPTLGKEGGYSVSGAY